MRMIFTSLALLAALPATALAQDIDNAEDDATDTNRGVAIAPYIEAAQVVTAELEPGDDVVTYTRAAVGVDAGFGGRYSQGSASLRYERRIGWDDDVADTDTVSGIARASLAVAGPAVTLEAGGLASRTRVDGDGSTSLGDFGADDDFTSQFYSVYAGPSARTQLGAAEVTGAYRIGYTRVESPDAVLVAADADPVDIFDEAVTQNAAVRAGLAPDTVLPVGVGVGAGWNRQDVSNLDQRIDDRYVRADVTVPVSPNVALVGGVGYEDVEVSSRDALRDDEGLPIRGPVGRFITDETQPRTIAYETDGLIWDVGVLWRPSRRTSAAATVGRRYGSTTYYGSLAYAPNARSSLNVSVYDTLNSFGGQVVGALDELGTDFDAFRNPISGDLGGCVLGVEGDNCALARLGSLRSAVFRNRGVSLSYGAQSGRLSYGIGTGYDRRSFFAGDDTVLAALDGVADETYWLAAYAARQLDQRSGVNLGGSLSLFQPGADGLGDALGYSLSAAYNRTLLDGLAGTAAVGLDGISREDLPDYSAASALVGLRYTF
ncbi:preprotein translocase subunit YajC [Aurantiacibacter aquimixticola]|uniref:Preprotein translocase subunit YajC n=1 Tax=Aurantiacibacter aquimixticola TaxID=1958945 RepID=A0A419RS74_9SPHN|nr:preprotein translocase subunit YajC [Aurantiacibacter aquimixticola]RJY08604.1 preprotein translocase subunit YajC [Aurantiacibacter aquimixticola]